MHTGSIGPLARLPLLLADRKVFVSHHFFRLSWKKIGKSFLTFKNPEALIKAYSETRCAAKINFLILGQFIHSSIKKIPKNGDCSSGFYEINWVNNEPANQLFMKNRST